MTHDPEFFRIWQQAVRAIYETNRGQWKERADGTDVDYVYGSHAWHLSVADACPLHACILRIIERECERPLDWHQLLLEWPHVSEDDDSMVAYTRNEEAGRDFPINGSKRQTKTTLGKYLARHWPHVPDHIRRDWAGRFKPAKFEIWDTIEGIISGVELGPQSCMKSSYGTVLFKAYDNEMLCAWRGDQSQPAPRWEKHPYIVYQPEFGWRMAVRLDQGVPDIVMARCLINDRDKTFVRSYKRGESETDYSHTDDKLETWLRDQGYSKKSGWSGKKLAVFVHPSGEGVMVPYLDGTPQEASHEGSHLEVGYGALDGTNTDGNGGSQRGTMGACDVCEDGVYEDDDDRVLAGRDEDTLVCGNCSDRFTLVRGNDRSARNGWANYYVRDDDAVCVGSQSYDADNLPACIVTLHDDEYCHKDDAVYLESEDAYYRCGDDDIVEVDGAWYLKDNDILVQCEDNEYRLRADCWQDHETAKWYSDDEEYITIGDKNFHETTVIAWREAAGQTRLNFEGAQA